VRNPVRLTASSAGPISAGAAAHQGGATSNRVRETPSRGAAGFGALALQTGYPPAFALGAVLMLTVIPHARSTRTR